MHYPVHTHPLKQSIDRSLAFSKGFSMRADRALTSSAQRQSHYFAKPQKKRELTHARLYLPKSFTRWIFPLTRFLKKLPFYSWPRNPYNRARKFLAIIPAFPRSASPPWEEGREREKKTRRRYIPDFAKRLGHFSDEFTLPKPEAPFLSSCVYIVARKNLLK